MARPDAAPRLILALALAAALTAGCTPRLAPPGPLAAAPIEPQLDEERLLTVDGLALPLRRWLPEGRAEAVILALHGFNDYSNAFAEAGDYWAERGIITYAYDQRGFGATPHRGLWPGSDALIGDLKSATRALRARHPDLPLFLLGESMGGAVILSAAADGEPLPADGMVLAAPAVWARSTMPWYQRAALWVAAHSIPWAELTGKGLDIHPSDNVEMLRALGKDPLVIKGARVDSLYGLVNLMDRALAAAPRVEAPALLLYGERDEIVPKDPSLRLWRRLPANARRTQRRALYADGWHMLLRDLQAETVLADIAHWVKDPAAPLPSGADRHALAALQKEGEATECEESESPSPGPEVELAEAPPPSDQATSADTSADPGPFFGC